MAKHNASNAPVKGEPVPYSGDGRVFNFDTDGLPFQELLVFIEALSTVSAVLSGLQEQSRFSTDSGYTATGGYLENVRVALGFEIDSVRDGVRERTVTNENEAGHKFDILIGEKLIGGERPSATVADLASIVAELDWQIYVAAQKGGAA